MITTTTLDFSGQCISATWLLVVLLFFFLIAKIPKLDISCYRMFCFLCEEVEINFTCFCILAGAY